MCLPSLRAYTRTGREGEGLGGGGGGKSAQPQPDTLADKSPPSLNHLRLKISSYHHVDDWREGGEDRVPSPAPPRRMLRGGGRRENRAQTAHGHQIFREICQASLSYRRAPTTTWSRPLCSACPPAVSPVSGTVYHEQAEFGGTALARWTQRSTPTPSPTRFGNGPKPATACARGNWTDRPDHTRTHIIMQILVTARGHGPRNRGTSQRGLPWQTLTISCLNHPGTRSCAITARLGTTWTSQPGTDTRTLSCCKNPRPYRPAVTASLPSHAVLTKSGATPPPTRSRCPPVHDISDSNSSDAEARPQWSCS